MFGMETVESIGFTVDCFDGLGSTNIPVGCALAGKEYINLHVIAGAFATAIKGASGSKTSVTSNLRGKVSVTTTY
jgi:hypothetical protein